MANTGRVLYGNLKQIYVDTGLPTTASTKTNAPTDADYVAPIYDLVACPVPPPAATDRNKISVQFFNNTEQVVVLKLITIKAEAIVDPTFIYEQVALLSLFPHTSSVAVIHDQLDNLTRVQFTVSNLSFNLAVQLSVQYEKHSEGSPTIIDSLAVGKNDSVNAPLPTPRESGSNTNLLMIVFDNL